MKNATQIIAEIRRRFESGAWNDIDSSTLLKLALVGLNSMTPGERADAIGEYEWKQEARARLLAASAPKPETISSF